MKHSSAQNLMVRVPQEQKIARHKQIKDITQLGSKIQKISNATYLLTDSLPDSEPLKGQLRAKSLDAVSGIYSNMSLIKDMKKNTLEEVQYILQELLAYYDIGHTNRFFSNMNYDIISREINAIIDHLVGYNQLDSSDDHVVSLSDLFKVSNVKPVVNKHSSGNDIIISNPKQEKDPQHVVLENKPLQGKKEQKDTPVFVQQKKPTLVTRQSVLKKTASSSVKKPLRKAKHNDVKEARHNAIMAILSGKKDLPINDICDQFDGVSSKTIQRDLSELIDQGKVVKQGSRRWSIYNLNS